MGKGVRMLALLVVLAAIVDGFLIYKVLQPSAVLRHSSPLAPSKPPEVVEICKGKKVERDLDGRLLDHFPYASADKAVLVAPPPLAAGNCQAVHIDIRPSLDELLKAARKEIGADLYAVSCHRSPAYQNTLFCGAKAHGIPPRLRAETVAPPGHSEHHTGYGVDFGSTKTPACEFQSCYGETRAGLWLKANAARYGFEMSFPQANRQGVSAEPWHWRWVGTGANAASRRARKIFGPARARFPQSSHSATDFTALPKF